MLEANLREVKIKGKVLRNAGFSTGTLRKKNGEVVPISLLSHTIDTYICRNGLNSNVELSLEGEMVNSKIDRVQKDLLVHNVINIDFIEV